MSPINCFFRTSFCFFFSTRFYLLTRFLSVLTLEYMSSTSRLATRAFLSLWLFLVLFRMLWMLLTCHMPHASKIITCRKIFTELFYCVSKEWVRYWSHASLVTNLKFFFKNFQQSVQKHWRERERRKKERQLQSA